MDQRPYSYLHDLTPESRKYRHRPRRNEMLWKEEEKFGKLCCEWLEKIGARYPGDSRDFQVDTSYGPLNISPYGHCVMCQFSDVERAKALLGHTVTAKWNHYYFDCSNERITAEEFLTFIKGKLLRILAPHHVQALAA